MTVAAITGLSVVAPAFPGAGGLVIRAGTDPADETCAAQEYLSKRIPKRMLRRMTHFGTMVVSGALAALDDAGITDDHRAHVGSVLGTAYGEIAVACQIFENGLGPGISPTAFHNSVHNASLGYLSIFGGLRGPSLSISDSTLSGEQALVEASSMLSDPGAGAFVVGSGDESCPSVFSPCWREGEEAPRETARGQESGGIIATDEACGFVVMEVEKRARERGARTIAVVREALAGADPVQVIGAASREHAAPDVIIVPAGLDRKADAAILEVVRQTFGHGTPVATEGDLCGYVPASGVIRCVMACRMIAHGAASVLVIGKDLDGHCTVVLLDGGGGS